VNTNRTFTIDQADEAAYRFVWQYYEREVSSESLALMLVAMKPVTDRARTSDHVFEVGPVSRDRRETRRDRSTISA
jgi:hypothetical protein